MSFEQLSTAVKFVAFFTNEGVGATGLTVTVDVRNPAGTEIVTAAAATEIGDGFYSYTLASGSTTTEGEYLAVFKTAGTVDQAHLPSLWVIGRGGVENLDAATSTRATPAQVTTIVGAIAGGGGSVEHDITITDDDNDPLDGVSVTVRATNDANAAAIATGYTDALGVVRFYLDPGTYWIWCQRGRTNFTNPTEVEVTV
jgi:hypothetical protein